MQMKKSTLPEVCCMQATAVGGTAPHRPLRFATEAADPAAETAAALLLNYSRDRIALSVPLALPDSSFRRSPAALPQRPVRALLRGVDRNGETIRCAL